MKQTFEEIMVDRLSIITEVQRETLDNLRKLLETLIEKEEDLIKD